LQKRSLRWTPGPHCADEAEDEDSAAEVDVHADHAVHSDQPPLTEKK
jgi:hypothetical protein